MSTPSFIEDHIAQLPALKLLMNIAIHLHVPLVGMYSTRSASAELRSLGAPGVGFAKYAVVAAASVAVSPNETSLACPGYGSQAGGSATPPRLVSPRYSPPPPEQLPSTLPPDRLKLVCSGLPATVRFLPLAKTTM